MVDTEKELVVQPGHAPSYDVEDKLHGDADRKTSIVSRVGEIVNASGHKDQLHRQYGLLSICALALTIDNAWVALGGSIVVAIGMRSTPTTYIIAYHTPQPMADRRACSTSSSSLAFTTPSSPLLWRRYDSEHPHSPHNPTSISH